MPRNARTGRRRTEGASHQGRRSAASRYGRAILLVALLSAAMLHSSAAARLYEREGAAPQAALLHYTGGL